MHLLENNLRQHQRFFPCIEEDLMSTLILIEFMENFLVLKSEFLKFYNDNELVSILYKQFKNINLVNLAWI